jgi:adenylate cyclase
MPIGPVRLLLLLFLSASPFARADTAPKSGPVVFGQDLERVSLAGPWAFKAGDDPAWAGVDVDDTGWQRIPVPGLWPTTTTGSNPAPPPSGGKQGGGPGFAWYRTTVAVPWMDGSEGAVSSWTKQGPSVAITAAGNSWELFAGGVKVGGFGVAEGPLAYPSPRVVAIPTSAVSHGTLPLALRVWREPHLPILDPTYSGVSGIDGDVVLGRRLELEDAAARTHLEEQRSEIPFGPVLFILLGAGVYHLQLFRRRHALREYLWLGLLLILLGVIASLHTWWWDGFSTDMGLRVKISVAGGFFVGVLFIEFLWPFLGKAITRRWRAYQAFQVVFGVVTFVSPGMTFLAESTPLRGLSWLPWIGTVVFLVVSEAWKKNPEARTIAMGLVAFLVCALYLILQNVGAVPKSGLNNGMLLLIIGATAFVLSMAVSLSNRFIRVYNSLDGLNRDLEQTYQAAARFVPVDFMRLIGRTSVRDVSIGDQVAMPMSILFCDVRGFTTLAEELGPERTFALINSYLRAMEPAIHGHHGFIRQYLGDGIMALFPGSADDAVQAAIDMHGALHRFNDERATRNEGPLAIGIGINTGPVMLGTIGGTDRLDSGVVGDAVNLASRIEGMTKAYGTGILLGAGTVAALADPTRYRLRELDQVVAKGRVGHVAISEVMDVLPDDTKAAREHHRLAYSDALEAFRRGDFATATAAFAAVATACPDDRPAQTMADRADEYRRSPPVAWTGATRLTSKS